MNLFDHYAGLAMQVELQDALKHCDQSDVGDAARERIAQRAYEMAAAMLRERNKVAMVLQALEGKSG